MQPFTVTAAAHVVLPDTCIGALGFCLTSRAVDHGIINLDVSAAGVIGKYHGTAAIVGARPGSSCHTGG